MDHIFTEKSKLYLCRLADTVGSELETILAGSETARRSGISDVMRYSVSAGGKRIRPALVLEFCRVCGGNVKNALPAACAMEMVHTFSLIHDDLPCMDNDDFRRGKPSCHKAYGEALALLAGDALLNLAYETVCRGEGLSAERKIALVRELTEAVGVNGMIGGQVIDTAYDGELTEALLLDMYGMKTGALLKAACRMGCTAAGADPESVLHAGLYAERLGLAFQLTDDILDIVGDEKLLGKPTGSDAAAGKTTYASLAGIEKTRETAARMTNEALAELDGFADSGFLRELTVYLLKRNY